MSELSAGIYVEKFESISIAGDAWRPSDQRYPSRKVRDLCVDGF